MDFPLDVLDQKGRSEREQHFLESVLPILKEQGLCLYDLEFLMKGTLIRLSIFDPVTKTATLEDCTKIDQALNPLFEKDDHWLNNVTLEVSSPGLFRRLKYWPQLQEAVGQRVSLEVTSAWSKRDLSAYPKGLKGQKNLIGELESIDLEEKQWIQLIWKGHLIKIHQQEMKKIQLCPDI
jgi:ribosome maturation factor RimP